jgi:pimeloyl-ACP methyl ester carboxylesterase
VTLDKFALGAAIAGLMASPVLAQDASPLPDAAPAWGTCPAEGQPTTQWLGMGQLHGGKGYVDTPMGQVHYRLEGPATGPVIVLLHQTPWSMIEFAQIQPCLARMGVRSLAIDTPGYGMSDAPPGKPSLAQYADNLIPVLDSLGIRTAVIAGHHTGAGIAIAFGARHPERTAGLLLHGTPVYTPAERAQRLAASQDARKLSDDGSHLSDYYASIRKYVGDSPGVQVTATWSTLAWYLAGASDVAHEAVFEAPSEQALRSVRAPVMIFTDTQDSLAENDRRAAALRPWFRLTEFSQDRSHALMLHPA